MQPLPPLPPQRSPSLHSVFHLIRAKKQELSRQLIADQQQLPHIHRDRQNTLQLLSKQQEGDWSKEKWKQSSAEEHTEQLLQTPAQKYRTILEVGLLSQETMKRRGREVSVLQLQSKQKEPLERKDKNLSNAKRVKTEVQEISRKGTNATQIDSHRLRESSEPEGREKISTDEAKERFLIAIQTIPKTMKLRNEASLLGAVQALETFNPFANRNHRIVNICLLKMGRTLFLPSSLLYKMGDELDCFYVILLGKVKLTNGPLRRLCQTGETVLEEVIFSDKQKKIALERAKTVGKTVLLEISMAALQRLKEELIKFGYKLGFQEMEAIIKRNYIVKNWLRNKIRLETNS